MSRLRLVGAVAIKVRPDTSDFREETQRGINQELGRDGKKVDAKATVEVNADTTPAKREFKRLEQEMEGKTFKVNVGMDYDSVQKAKRQIDKAMDSLDNKVIDFEMNKESLAKARRELRDLAQTVRVKMEYDKDEAGYKSILAKIQRIRKEKDNLVDVPISFKTDELSLRREERKAKDALARIEAEKTVDIRYSDNYDGIKKAIGELDAQLEEVRKLKITTKLDEDSLLAAKGDLQDMMQFADVTIKFNEDKQGYETVLSRIRAIQREKLEKEITFSTDDESLRREARKYEDLIDQANERAQIAARFEPVTIEYNEDLAGYTAALEHIKKLQREKLVKKITFNTDEADLAYEVERFKRLVESATPKKVIEFEYNNSLDSLNSALKRVDDEISKNWDIKIPIEADTGSLVAFRAKLQALIRATPIEMKINEDRAGFQSVIDKIKSIQRERAVVDVTFDTDEKSLRLKLAEMQGKLKELDKITVTTALQLNRLSVDEAEHEAKKLKDKIDHLKGSMQVELAGSALVSARLSFLGRDRIVNYIANVNTRSILVAEGLLKSLGGVNTLSSLGRGLESLFTKFDTLSLKIGTVATVLGNFANVGLYAFTSVVKVGEGVVQSLGLLAAAPAILGAATVGYTIFTAAFNNFFDAFNKDPKIAKSALEALPPVARKTVDSITGLYKGLANPIQEKFWERVGTTLSDSIENLYPRLKESLLDSTTAVGDFVAGIGKSFNKLSLSDDFDKMFAGFNGFFTNLSGASEPFFDAWNKLGVQGSTLLPEFGKWLTDLAKQFDGWATSMSANGGITDMIMHGVSSLQAMWRVGGDVVDIFKALAKAAGLAGTGGLAEFEQNLRKTADRMNSEPWQSKAKEIFEGAREGASALNDGFHDMTGTLGDAAVWLGNVLELLGQIGGASLSRLSDLFGSARYQSGVTAELQGMRTLIDNLDPAFAHLGGVIGNMGVVAGAVFAGLAGVINQAMGLLDDVTSTLSANLADVAPKMAATVSGVLSAVTPLVMTLTNLVNGVLGIVGQVPDSFVALSVAVTAFFALRALSSQFYNALSGTSTFKNLEARWLAQQAAAGKTVESYKMVNGTLQKIEVPTGKFNAFTTGFQAMRDSVGGLKREFEIAQRASSAADMGQFRSNLAGASAVAGTLASKGLAGLTAALGGPWGIAIAVAGLAIGAFAQEQQKAAKLTDTLTQSIDKQTGALDANGVTALAKAWTDLDEANDAGANWNRGVIGNMKAADETARHLGLNFQKVTDTIVKGGPDYDLMVGRLKSIQKYKEALELKGSGKGGNFLFDMPKLQSEAEDASEALSGTGLNLDGLNAKSIGHLIGNIEEGNKTLDKSRFITEGLAKATGDAGFQTGILDTAISNIADNAKDAASKIGDIKTALDLLNGGTMTSREAEVNAAKVSQSAVDRAKAIRDELKENQHLIDGTTGLIDETSKTGLELQQIMEGSADAILIQARAAYQAATDAGKTPAEAMEAAKTVIAAGHGELQKIADAAGIDVKILETEWAGFFGKDWTLTAVFTASPKQFMAAKEAVEAAGLTFDQKTYEAFLKANPDPSKITIDQAKAWATEYANGQYKAQLDAMPQEALGKILEVTGLADEYKKGDYQAVMKALNDTNPGVAEATKGLWAAVTNGGAGWAAAIKAYLDAQSKNLTEGELATLARNRDVNMIVRYGINGPRPEELADGGIFKNNVRTFANGGIIKAFANGGFENHVAQIAYKSPQVPFRIWAEAEGGEAYIPLAASKRGRSTQILSQVASQFGLTLSNGKAVQYANGGVTGTAASSGGTHIHIDAQPGLSYQYAQEVAYAAATRFRDAQAVYNILN